MSHLVRLDHVRQGRLGGGHARRETRRERRERVRHDDGRLVAKEPRRERVHFLVGQRAQRLAQLRHLGRQGGVRLGPYAVHTLSTGGQVQLGQHVVLVKAGIDGRTQLHRVDVARRDRGCQHGLHFAQERVREAREDRGLSRHMLAVRELRERVAHVSDPLRGPRVVALLDVCMHIRLDIRPRIGRLEQVARLLHPMLDVRETMHAGQRGRGLAVAHRLQRRSEVRGLTRYQLRLFSHQRHIRARALDLPLDLGGML